MLHITNGDSTRIGLEGSGLPGTIQPWRDVLYDGPTPSQLPAERFRRVRSDFIAAGGAFGPVEDIEREYAREDAAVTEWDGHTEMVLWFEHDLYDQLLLIRLLSMLAERHTGNVSLVCSTTYLGPLQPGEFPALFEKRRPVTTEQIALGARAWRAFGADTPDPIVDVAGSDTSALPYLGAALRRLIEEYPSERNGLGRSEYQLLRSIDDGARTGAEAFVACNRMEDAIFMGDSTFWGIAGRLASGASPLMTIGGGMTEAVAMTSAGADVLAGRADAIALIGIDRWLGGVHLAPSNLWRRRPDGGLRPSP